VSLIQEHSARTGDELPGMVALMTGRTRRIDVVGAVLDAASAASSFTSGAVLEVDGGWR
jgi:NAD(P)-dependent dehydrogenase (short-subunit alcohol dehydrogenase family)